MDTVITAHQNLWHHTDFNKLWFGETISVFGSQIAELALPLTAILALNASPSQVGFLSALRFVPFIMFSLLFGVWLDRRQRRPMMIYANLARAALLALIPILWYLDILQVAVLYVVAFLIGTFSVIFELAYLSYLPTLVGSNHLVEGNTKLQASTSAAAVGGNGLGGLLIQALGAPLALLINALSFSVSALSLWNIQYPEVVPQNSTVEFALVKDVKDGLKAVFGNHLVRVVAGEAATYNFFNQIILTTFLLYATRELELSAGIIGLLFSMAGIGVFFGSAVTMMLERCLGYGRATILGTLLTVLAPMLLLLAKGNDPASIMIMALSFFLGGVGMIANILIVTIRLAVTPPHLLSRMNASYRLLTFGTIPLGALLAGYLGEAFDLRTALIVGVLGLPTAVLWLVFSEVRCLNHAPTSASVVS